MTSAPIGRHRARAVPPAQTGPPAVETGPAAVETGPAAVETGPAAVETGPAAVEIAADVTETSPAAEGARVAGTVRTDDGWPLPGAAVTVLSAGGLQAGRGLTDQVGAFLVPAGAGGPVTLIVAAPGMQPVARGVTADPAGRTAVGAIVLVTEGRTGLPPAGLYHIDPAHTIIRATARHLGLSHVEGRFTEFSGTIRLAHPIEASTVAVSIEAASINTGNADRDRHLRSPDFLDVERFPKLTFGSTRVTMDSAEHGRVYGYLTIRDIEREVVLDMTYKGSGPDPWGGMRIAVKATTQLARRDYEINWNMGIPGGLVVVGPTLRIDLEVQAVQEIDDAGPGPDR